MKEIKKIIIETETSGWGRVGHTVCRAYIVYYDAPTEELILTEKQFEKLVSLIKEKHGYKAKKRN